MFIITLPANATTEQFWAVGFWTQQPKQVRQFPDRESAEFHAAQKGLFRRYPELVIRELKA